MMLFVVLFRMHYIILHKCFSVPLHQVFLELCKQSTACKDLTLSEHLFK